MGLIKSAQAPATLRAFSMADIEKQARAILMRAQQQAEQLLAEAQKEAAALRQQGREQGLQEGRREGMVQGREEGMKMGREVALAQMTQSLTSAVTAFTNAAGTLDASRRELEAGAVHDVLELALQMAGKITRRQGECDRSVVVDNVAQVVRLVVGATAVRIAVNPKDHAALAAALPGIRMQLPRLEHIELIDDEALDPGGCRVFTAGGEIDATIKTQLQRIAADLLPDHQEPGQ